MKEDFSEKKKRELDIVCKIVAIFLVLALVSTLIAFVWGAGLWGFLMWFIIWTCFGFIASLILFFLL